MNAVRSAAIGNRNREAVRIIVLGVLAVALYFWVARILLLPYMLKSAIKIVLFLGVPVYCRLRSGRSAGQTLRDWIVPPREQLPHLIRTAVFGILIILAANLLVEPLCRWFGIESVIGEIQARTHTTRQRLWLAMLYIPIVNALAEELFFRAFGVLELTGLGFGRLALILPATLFALYHLAIFQNWFSPAILALCLGGLFLCGLLLGLMVRRDRNVAGVWLLHGLVNVAIISISIQFF